MSGTNQFQPVRMRRLAGAVLACLLVGTALLPTAQADPRIKCGRPKKSGTISVAINLKRGDEVHQILLAEMTFGPTSSGADKAQFIKELITGLLDPNGDYIVPVRADGDSIVEIHPQNGWEIIGPGLMQDGTGEPDWLAYDGASHGEPALCSLSGTATGTAPDGGPGLVTVQLFGAIAQCPTSPGMPSQAIENYLMQQLQAQGVAARWAVPGDFTGPFSGLTHDDMVLFLTTPSGAIGRLAETVSDNGLTLDLLALAVPAAPSDVPPAVGALAPLLEVRPNVEGPGPMTVTFATTPGNGWMEIRAFDVEGRSVCTLLRRPEGTSGSLSWEGRDDDGRRLRGGVYFLRLDTPHARVVRRIVRVP